MLIDTHVHTKRCKHADGDLEDYVNEAIKKNIKILCFTEHAPLDLDPDKRLSLEESKKYIEDIKKLKLKYEGKIKILIGFEIDYMEQFEDEIREFINSTKADFYLGSIHFIPFNKQVYTIWDYENIISNKDLLKEYFRLMKKAINTRLFQSISHPDLILRTGIKEENLLDEFKYIVEELAKNNVCYEINCSGLFKTKYNQNTNQMENGEFLGKKYLHLASNNGVSFTIGSDAHKVKDIGKGVIKMFDYSRNNNFKLCYFEDKEKIGIKK